MPLPKRRGFFGLSIFVNCNPKNSNMAEIAKDKNTIKDWAADDRPREKMIAKGRNALSDAELIAILINSGNQKQTSVELARDILHSAHDNLIELSKLSITDLMQHPGIGEAKSISIVAALELGRRRRYAEALELPTITSSSHAFEYLYASFSDFSHEQFLVLFLNQGNKVLKMERISNGGMTATVVDPKIVFKKALESNATALILCHNHPSGEVKPSQQDINMTSNMEKAGKILEIKVLDHIIIGNDKYFSFADEGMI